MTTATLTPPTTRTRRPVAATLAAVGLLASILLANYATARYGFVPVGFGLMATAGTFAAGFALALRDAVQDAGGRRAVLAVILVGATLSLLIAPAALAVASGVAFLVAELADFAVYTPLRNRSKLGDRRWSAAVILSNLVGAVVDTVVFLGIAFGLAAVTFPALAGQLVGKGWATAAYLVAGFAFAAYRRR